MKLLLPFYMIEYLNLILKKIEHKACYKRVMKI